MSRLRRDFKKNITMKNTIIIILMVLFSLPLMAQGDLLSELEQQQKDTMKLLPHKMLFTQRMLWGNRGLMRHFNSFALTKENREKELKIRRTMLVIHQITGFTTLGLMAAQSYVGWQVYNGNHSLAETHEALAGVTDVFYFTTASLALFAPPKMIDEHKGYSSIKVHKALAIIHFSSMIATNILGPMVEDNPQLKPYHRAAALTAFGSLFAAMVIIKF